MGKEKYLKDVENLFKKSYVVNAKSIEIIVKNKKKCGQYTKQLIRNLILKNKIKRLTKGCYTLYDNIELAVFCFKPSYLGLQDALSFHNLWEQETIPIIITSRKIRPGVRRIIGNNVLIRRIAKKYFFGFDHYNQNNIYLPYSNMEKTLIDMIYFNENLDKETLKNIKKRLKKEKLRTYLKAYPKRFREKILKMLA